MQIYALEWPGEGGENADLSGGVARKKWREYADSTAGVLRGRLRECRFKGWSAQGEADRMQISALEWPGGD